MATKKKAAARKVEECNVDGCRAPVKKLGVCAQHAAENCVLECDVEGCDRELFSKGRCKPHYMRKYRKKRKEAAPSEAEPIRAYGQKRFDVFTRIPEEAASVILRAAGRDDGMYEKAAEILMSWADKHQASASH